MDYGKKKKKKRLADQAWAASNNKNGKLPWPTEDIFATEDPNVILETGRPRMPPLLVLVFMLIRGTFGGFKSREVQILLTESTSLYVLFNNLRVQTPGLSTITENVNAITNRTRDEILTLQLQSVLGESLDDFTTLLGDSTSVEGNTAYPTDSSILVRLVERILNFGQSIKKYGIRPIEVDNFIPLIKKVKSLAKEIAFTAGKKGSKRKVKRLYARLLKRIKKIHEALKVEIKKIETEATLMNLMPSKKAHLWLLVSKISEDHDNLLTVSDYCKKWFFKEEKTNSKEKVLSLADINAAFIQKGNREAVIGYKPQLARSKNGFISGITIPEGNAADSAQFQPLIDDAIKRLGITPSIISVDDGYTNTAARNNMLENGTKIVSISGAKGKRLIPKNEYESDDYQDARNERSAVESLMFTIKNNHKFGRVMRRGIENVRAELLEKVLAYNLARAVLIRIRNLKKKAA